jgi:hypothetical protein
MVPTFVRVALTLKDVLEAKVANRAPRIILSPSISKATLDIIGLVGKKKLFKIIFFHITRDNIKFSYFFRFQL